MTSIKAIASAVLLGVVLGLVLLDALRTSEPAFSTMSGILAPVVTLLILIAGVGLLLRRDWGRWLGLAVGLGGLAFWGSALLTWEDPVWPWWMLGIFALLVALLIYEPAAPRRRPESDRWAVVLTQASVPPLVLYASWVLPPVMSPSPAIMRAGAALAALAFVLGATLVILGRRRGGLALLGVGGAAALTLAVAILTTRACTASLRHEQAYGTVFGVSVFGGLEWPCEVPADDLTFAIPALVGALGGVLSLVGLFALKPPKGTKV